MGEGEEISAPDDGTAVGEVNAEAAAAAAIGMGIEEPVELAIKGIDIWLMGL